MALGVVRQRVDSVAVLGETRTEPILGSPTVLLVTCLYQTPRQLAPRRAAPPARR